MALGDFLKRFLWGTDDKIYGNDEAGSNRSSRDSENDFGPSGLPRNIEDDLLNYKNPMQNFNFNFTTPGSHMDDEFFEVEQQMFKQLDDMMNSIFKGFNVQDIFPSQDQIERHADQQPKNDGKSLRDKMLNSPNDGDGGTQIFKIEPFDEDNEKITPWFRPPSLFEELWRYPFRDAPQQPNLNRKIDDDLDDEMMSGKSRLDDIFANKQNKSKTENTPWTGGGSSFFWSSSSSSTTTPDGGLESRKTVRDSQGNEEVTITRTFGDQSHSYTKKKDSNGIEEMKEDFINMKEADLKEFDEMWQRK